MPARSGRHSGAASARRPHILIQPELAMISRLASVSLATVLTASIALPSAAQQGPPETIRGRVTDDSSHALHVTVKVTRGPDRLTLEGATDSLGAYRVRFDVGSGDYLVYVSAPGFRAARRRVQSVGGEHELSADFVLTRDVAVLGAMVVTAAQPERASNRVNPMEPEPGAAERWSDGINGQVPPAMAGDLAAIAGTFSNVGISPAGPTILGSGPESNLATLNGMALGAASLPRAAQTETRVSGATFDATRGGFSGASIDVRLAPGSRWYQRRRAFLTLNPAALQFADPTSRSLGATNRGMRASLGADGEIVRDALTYNAALDVSRSVSDPATLLIPRADVLWRAGLSSDSVQRLVAAAGPLGLTLAGRGVPPSDLHDAVTWLGRLDDTRDTLTTRALTTYLEFARDGAEGLGVLAAPSTATSRRRTAAGAQFLQDVYVGPGRRVLNETRGAVSGTRSETRPYAPMPGATVLLGTSASASPPGVTAVSVGGSSSSGTSDSQWSAEAANETDWNAGGRRHRYKLLLWGRADGLRQDAAPNSLGSFSYNSLAEFIANRPSAFSRSLVNSVNSGSVWNGALAFADRYAPNRYFNVLYGARLEADGFVEHPPTNRLLEEALGVRTGAAPARLHLSPRLGFSYSYNRSRQNGGSVATNAVGRFRAGASGVISGGIGEFRDLLRPGVLAAASTASGLAGGPAFLSCSGSAVPAASWSAFSDPQTIPTTCADGAGPLGERAPSASLIASNFDVPRSWRAALAWNTSRGYWLFHADGLASYDLSQPGTIDANFSGRQQLVLSHEGGRPVFVSAAGIDPASGALSASEARTSGAFGPVATRVSDLRGYGGQLTVGVAPDVFKMKSGISLFTSASYTLQRTRRQYRGFDGAAFGDPRTVEWSANASDARHVLVLSGGFATPKVGAMTIFARLQSGLPFTPIVAGDVNGDGIGGDRAFVPNPATETDHVLAGQVGGLLATGSATARACLAANLGEVAERNGCRGPWTQIINVQWTMPTPSRWAGRARPSVYLQNVAAGVDQLLHGSALRGWGSSATPDPVLLVPRGFDAGATRFRYDVNPRFADTRPGRSLAVNPFRIVLDISVDLSTNYDLQSLRRAVEPLKTPTGFERRSADSLTSFYLQRTSSVHRWLLSESDSLFISRDQATALQRADSIYADQVRAVYVPLGQFLASANGAAGPAQMDSVRAADKAYQRLFWAQVEIADAIISPTQRELMPFLKRMLGASQGERERERYSVGFPVAMTAGTRR